MTTAMLEAQMKIPFYFVCPASSTLKLTELSRAAQQGILRPCSLTLYPVHSGRIHTLLVSLLL